MLPSDHSKLILEGFFFADTSLTPLLCGGAFLIT
jgi:hypothetical protein